MKNSEIELIDNALSEEDFNKLSYHINNHGEWLFKKDIVDDSKSFPISYFVHAYYDYHEYSTYVSYDFEVLKPIIKIIKPNVLKRVKANMYVNQNKFAVHDYHRDSVDDNMKIGLFYLNSNDGYTEFLDGTKVESVANRLILFNSSLVHRSTNCINDWNRITINFNYY